MLRVLTLSTLFPDATRPSFGVFVERQTQALSRREGVDVKVVAAVGAPPWPLSRHPRYRVLAGLPRRETWHGLDVHRPRFAVWPGTGGAGMPRAMARAVLPLLREIRREFAFDVIDAEFFYPDGPAAMRLADALGVPFSVKARGADIHHWGRAKGTARQVLAAGRAAGGMLAVSGALAEDMAALGLPGARVHYTGVDLGAFRPAGRAAAKAALGVDGPLLLCVGHLIPRKGQALLIEAMRALPEATLLLVGEGPDRAALEAQAAPFGPRVRFLGSVRHDLLPELHAAADVMALPSSSEGLANVWVEALACGTPIVIADVGGAREVLEGFPQAGRIAAREPLAIAKAVREMLAAAPRPEVVRAAAERFTWEANAAALESHLRGIAGL